MANCFAYNSFVTFLFRDSTWLAYTVALRVSLRCRWLLTKGIRNHSLRGLLPSRTVCSQQREASLPTSTSRKGTFPDIARIRNTRSSSSAPMPWNEPTAPGLPLAGNTVGSILRRLSVKDRQALVLNDADATTRRKAFVVNLQKTPNTNYPSKQGEPLC